MKINKTMIVPFIKRLFLPPKLGWVTQNRPIRFDPPDLIQPILFSLHLLEYSNEIGAK